MNYRKMQWYREIPPLVTHGAVIGLCVGNRAIITEPINNSTIYNIKYAWWSWRCNKTYLMVISAYTTAVGNRNFTIFFNVVVTRRPVLHFLFNELVQRTVTAHSAHRIASAKTASVEKWSYVKRGFSDLG